MQLNGIDLALKEKGMTRQELADYLNITASGLGRYIRGEREAPYEVLRSMCSCLNLSADYILNTGITQTNDAAMPEDELQLLSRYHRLSDDGKEILRAEALKMTRDYPATQANKKAI